MDSKIAIGRGLDLFYTLVKAHPELQREHELSKRMFFPDAAVRQATAPYPSVAARRHLEWFLFDQPSEAVDGLPAHALMEAWEEAATGEVQDFDNAFRDSLAGIFRVTSVEPGRGAWLRDLLGLGEYPVAEPDEELDTEGEEGIVNRPEVGDLVVGRLYPVGDSVFCLSPAAGQFREKELATAIENDVQQLRDGRRGSLRVEQAELERMFFSGASIKDSDTSDARAQIATARRRLEAIGLGEADIDACFEHLSSAAPNSTDTVLGNQDALANLLEELAFETAVDLEEARQALLLAWPALHAPGIQLSADEVEPPPSIQPTPDLLEPVASPDQIRQALAEFDAARSQGMDVEKSFAELERQLGLSDGDGADAPTEDVPDFPGVVGAMIEEFRWEKSRRSAASGAPEAREHDPLQLLAEYGKDVGVFENLRANDLLAFCALWCLEQGRLSEPCDADALLEALREFCTWCDTEHELKLWSDFEPIWNGLAQSLPRIVSANAALSLADASNEVGELFELEEQVAATGELHIRSTQGKQMLAEAPARAGAQLQSGDILRAVPSAHAAGKALRPLRFYPPEACELLIGSAPD